MSLPRLPPTLRTPAVLAMHAGASIGAYVGAYALRFDGRIPGPDWQTLEDTTPLLLLSRLSTLALFGVYQASWRHVGISDLLQLVRATTVGTMMFALVVLMWGGLDPPIPRSIFGIESLLFLTVAGGVRLVVRCSHEGRFALRAPSGRRTLVIGAGAAAERLLRENGRDGQRSLHVVGLLDDDPAVRRVSLHGLKVLDGIDQVGTVVRRAQIELIVIAIPSATGEQMRRIVRLCSETGVEYKTIPSLHDLAGSEEGIGKLRDVQVEDLLGRAPVHLDLDRVERDLGGGTVLVTGAAGSIGSELARQVAGFSPTRLILLDQAESPLYFIHLELLKSYPALEIVPVVADVTNRQSIVKVFERHSPAIVFHAAAYKHVPLCENNVVEAVRNNVFGTLNLAACAVRFRTKKFILISSDKAVNPSSIMGTTKRVAERIVLGWPRFRAATTDFRAVRFGNVLGSDGSVVPVFKRQIAAGGPITVTHPHVRRYFMSIREAVELVLQAAALPDAAGRILMLEMGEPVRIVDLAEQLVRLSGLTPHRDIQIVYTGLRPGEKLDEELVSGCESHSPTDVAKLCVVDAGGSLSQGLEEGVAQLRRSVRLSYRAGAIAALRRLVPEYLRLNSQDGFGDREMLEEQEVFQMATVTADRAVVRREFSVGDRATHGRRTVTPAPGRQ